MSQVTEDRMDVDFTRGQYRRIYAGAIFGRRINSVGHLAERLFWRMVAACDDFGNHPWSVLLVRHQLIPLLTVDAGETHAAMEELEQAGLVIAYTHRGEHFAHVVGHQDIQPSAANGRRARRFPACPSEDADFEPDGESGGILVDPDFPGESGGHNNNNNNNNQQQPCVRAHAKPAAAAAAAEKKIEPELAAPVKPEARDTRAEMHLADAAGITPGEYLRLANEFPRVDWPGILGSIAARVAGGQTIRNPAGLCRRMAREGFTPAAEGRKKGAAVLTAKQRRVIAAVQAEKQRLRRLWDLPDNCDLSGEAWKARWPTVTREQKAEWDAAISAAAVAARKEGA